MAHLSAATEVEVTRQGPDTWVLVVGSGAWDSPSRGRLTLFSRPADLRRIAHAILEACPESDGTL